MTQSEISGSSAMVTEGDDAASQRRLSIAGEKVLKDILNVGAERSLALGRRLRVPTPGPEDLYTFCEILAEQPGEEVLQEFLEKHPGFVTGLLGGPDNTDLALLFKPRVGTQYKADFCVLQAHQGGAVAHLVEIESSHEKVFTKDGRTAQRLAGAMKQIEDWRIWIRESREHYSRELVRTAQALPVLANYVEGDKGFRLCEPATIEQHWRNFGGFTDPIFTFTIIIGRWSQLSSEEKARVLNRNRQPGQRLRVHTYEQLARSANYRLERDDWHNAHDDWGSLDGLVNTFDPPEGAVGSAVRREVVSRPTVKWGRLRRGLEGLRQRWRRI